MSNKIFNVYCDESCHLPNDKSNIMVLGAIWCPKEKSRTISKRLKDLRLKHNLSPSFEIKWNKVSHGKEQFYLDLVDVFFDESDLRFRALVIPEKNKLRHDDFNQDHDMWYYKMYFTMLKAILEPENKYHFYLDIKDTRSAERVKKLHQVLCNNIYDFDRTIIERVQSVESKHISQVQMADFFIGAISYLNRGLTTNSAKVKIIERIKHHSKKSLTQSTLLRENKLNIFFWKASERES